MNKKILTFAILLLVVVGVGATAAILFMFPYKPTEPPAADDTGATQQGVQQLVNANNRFGLELYKELANAHKEKNIFISPYSIFSALAITYEGALGKTAEEMKSVMHYPDLPILRPNFAAIYNQLNRGNEAYVLRTGNALWVQKDFELLDSYTNNVERFYSAKAANVDFVNEREKTRQTINQFIEQQTNHMIKDLIPKDTLNTLTRLVITNAIYFKGSWVWQFDPDDTQKLDFYITPDSPVKVDMMYMKPEKAWFNYTETDDLQVLELPYKGNKLSMLVLLPKDNFTIYELESSLTLDKLNEYRNNLEKIKLDAIYLPKFEFNTKYILNKALEQLGMRLAFTDSADFSGMTGKPGLYISKVLHQAFVRVDEKGTEAAAATAVVISLTAVQPSIVFRADHPFIFIIQDRSNGSILFIGRVANPNG